MNSITRNGQRSEAHQLSFLSLLLQTESRVQRLKTQRQGFSTTEGNIMFDKLHFDEQRQYQTPGAWVQ